MAANINTFKKIEHEATACHARLVAVSKTKPARDIQSLYDAGQRVFGENYVQELQEKHGQLPPDIEWHFIGHLQRNKVKYIVPFVSMIQTVDSLALLQEINKQAAKSGRIVDCLVEIHIAREASKTGLEEANLIPLLQEVVSRKEVFSQVRLRGLMGMATFTDDEQVVRGEFRRLKALLEHARDRFKEIGDAFTELSMGMSADYVWALEEGSTLIRVGSLLFWRQVTACPFQRFYFSLSIMRCQLLPVVDRMVQLYRQPPGFNRFSGYLKILQKDTKGDLLAPVGGYNPMAKAPAVAKLLALSDLQAEAIMGETLSQLSLPDLPGEQGNTYSFALVLSDDLQGGWTNRFTTDFANKFRMQALVKRGLGTVVCWTSEVFSPALIRERTLESVFRLAYWVAHGKPWTLRQHFDQEVAVARNAQISPEPYLPDVRSLRAFLAENGDSESYSLIFNFFYGDQASESLAYPAFGITEQFAGFRLAAQTAAGR